MVQGSCQVTASAQVDKKETFPSPQYGIEYIHDSLAGRFGEITALAEQFSAAVRKALQAG
jgi:hypothetical protein